MFEKYKISVIIPVYNNGYYLKDKCFKSLQKSSMFKDLEIIIVDDGSDDIETIEIIKTLDKKYRNVKSFFLPIGGSGSASRPRNYGVRKATSKYITYLDPDNEASNDGYSKLFNCTKEYEYDLVLGNMKRIIDKDNILYFSFYNHFLKANKYKDTCFDGLDILKKLEFKVNSIQALIVKKDIIIHNNLLMEDGAIGQDTVFFMELIMCCKSIKVINEEIHIYNSSRKESVTNQLNESYFLGHYKNENKKIQVLKKYKIMDEYLSTIQEYYFKAYIFDKFNELDDINKEKIEPIIRSIYELYNGKWHIKNQLMRNFFNKYNKQGLSK